MSFRPSAGLYLRSGRIAAGKGRTTGEELRRALDVDALPGSDADYPSQDDVDRRDDFAFIMHVKIEVPVGSTPGDAPTWDDQFWPAVSQFRIDLPRLVTEVVKETADLDLFPHPISEHYQVGPAAGGLGNSTDLIVTVAHGLQGIPPAFDVIANTWAIAKITRLTVAKTKRWARAKRIKAAPIFPPVGLARLCEDHVRRAYHPRAKLTTDWYSTSPEYYGGYMSPSRPSGNQTYLVTVQAERRTYCHAVRGGGTANTHYAREGSRTTHLARPDLLSLVDSCD